MVKKSLLSLLVFLVSTSAAFSETMRAICGPFKGNTIGVSGSTEYHKPLSYLDSIDGKFTFIWEVNSKKALIIGPVQVPSQEEGEVVLHVSEQVSAVVIEPESVFLYSIFPQRKLMLITKHTHLRDYEFNAARGFVMQGDCEINIE